MTYSEDLPDQCPPSDAMDQALDNVCRFLFFDQDDPQNYYSHHKLGKPTGKASECRAKSLSLFRVDAVPNVLQAKRMAFFKGKKISVLNVPVGAGQSHVRPDGHIDLWAYRGYDPASSLVGVCEPDEDLENFLKDGN